jgi:hypothetical protein
VSVPVELGRWVGLVLIVEAKGRAMTELAEICQTSRSMRGAPRSRKDGKEECGEGTDRDERLDERETPPGEDGEAGCAKKGGVMILSCSERDEEGVGFDVRLSQTERFIDKAIPGSPGCIDGVSVPTVNAARFFSERGGPNGRAGTARVFAPGAPLPWK